MNPRAYAIVDQGRIVDVWRERPSDRLLSIDAGRTIEPLMFVTDAADHVGIVVAMRDRIDAAMRDQLASMLANIRQARDVDRPRHERDAALARLAMIASGLLYHSLPAVEPQKDTVPA